jgi:AraC-like DNA-binding protein
LATLAASLGYASECAFSIAFKRTVGVAPRVFRDSHRRGFTLPE